MNGNCSTTGRNSPERLPDTVQLEHQWKSIDWKKAEAEVSRLQARIAKATQEKKWNTVKRLQYLLSHSYYAKALAVRKVTTNKGKHTPGIDKELWNTPAVKMRNVLILTDKGYKAKPLRRVFIEKPGKKKQGNLPPCGKLSAGLPGNVPSAFRVCMTERCRHFTHWPSTQYLKQQRMKNHLDSAEAGRRKTPVSTFLRHSAGGALRSGCWRATSRAVSTISAMTG